MAEGRISEKSVKIAEFAKVDLEILVETLSSTFRSSRLARSQSWALVLAARRSPTETVAAVLHTYWSREREAAAVAAVCGFIQAHGRDTA
jgi:hypothetical protein